MNLPDPPQRASVAQSSPSPNSNRPCCTGNLVYRALQLAFADLNPSDDVWMRIKRTLQEPSDSNSRRVSRLARH